MGGAAAAEKAAAKAVAKSRSRRRCIGGKRARQKQTTSRDRQDKNIVTTTAKITGTLCGSNAKATRVAFIVSRRSIEQVPKISTLRGSGGNQLLLLSLKWFLLFSRLLTLRLREAMAGAREAL